MKVKFCIYLLLLLILALPMSATAEQDEASMDSGGRFRPYVFFAPSLLFPDAEQFGDSPDTSALEDLSPPLGLQVGIGADQMYGRHMFLFYDTVELYDASSDDNDQTADLFLTNVLIHPGYGYAFAPWFSLRCDLGIGASFWRYSVITGSEEGVNGDARGNGLLIRPQAEARFDLPIGWFFNIFGGYSVNAVNFDQSFSGDWDEDSFDDLDLNHPFVGIGFGIRF